MSDRWRRIQDLFFAALELDASKRDAFLRGETEGDDELRREVESMLTSQAESRALDLEERLVDGDEAIARSSIPAGTRVGPYRIGELIGRGGMAEVYRAERDDEQYKQVVALKLIRRGFESAEIVRRFRAERQILARLQHASIARLTDGGIHEDGRPFLVMELVEGMRVVKSKRLFEGPTSGYGIYVNLN